MTTAIAAEMSNLGVRGLAVTGIPQNRLALGRVRGQTKAEAPRSAGTAPAIPAYLAKVTLCGGPRDSRARGSLRRAHSDTKITLC